MLVRNRDDTDASPEALAVSAAGDSLKGLEIYVG